MPKVKRMESQEPTESANRSNKLKVFSKLKTNKKLLWALGGALIIVLVLFIMLFPRNRSLNSEDNRIEIKDARAKIELNREFLFPLKDEKGQEVSKIKFIIQNAELRDEIVLSKQKSQAVKGRVFLILNIKITNDSDKSLKINTRDYVRLQINGNEDKLAANIHNDPVSVQPISTQPTRLGFPINDSDKNLKLRIGEINGEKTNIDLKF